ncbi:MAG: Uma2 family endonuclease [Acidobacteriota bacterium]|nr:Uma2 family endonuclease [Acidobacteriota bacterium]
MSSHTFNLHAIIESLPAGSFVVLPDVNWNEYEDLLEQIGESRGVRTSYCDGKLQIMVVSSKHEKYAWFIGRLISTLSLRLRINILFFGAPTMRKEKRRKGLEPDACFYVQSAPLIGNRIQIDFTTDPPPDIAVEIDIHHGSISKFPIYAALGVGEVWRYDGEQLQIHLLKKDAYVPATESQAVPMLTGDILTNYLARLREEGEMQSLVAFDEWLQTQAGDGGQGKGTG